MFQRLVDWDIPFIEIHPKLIVMDNHKWAFYHWEKYRYGFDGFIKLPLVHIDYHWDGVCDFYSTEDRNRLIQLDNIEDIFEFVKSDRIQFDSFIAPAIIRGLVNEIHNFCFDTDKEKRIDSILLEEFNIMQGIHEDISVLVEKIGNRTCLLDIDLDVFKYSEDSNGGNLWHEREIVSFLSNIKPLILNSAYITIAISSDFFGTKDDIQKLTNFVISRILKYLN